MSLLIDALKQAEAARQRSEEGSTPPAGDDSLSLAPLDPPAAAPAAAPQGAGATQPPAQAVRRSRPAPESPRDSSAATRELFEVKQQEPSRLPYYLLAFAIIALVAGGAYVWWAMQPRSALLATGHNNQTPTQAVTNTNAQAAEPVSAPPVVTTESSQQSPAQRSSLSTGIPPSPRRNRVTLDSQAPAVAEESAVKIRPGSGPASSTAPSSTQQAYDALAAGDLRTARQLYQEALRLNSQNVDALNGLGLIAAHDNQPDQAERYFRAALRADPADGIAASQLALLYADGDPASAEARLRNLIASQPASAAGHFALGNLLSRQQRWSEAQQTLFQAYTLDSNNPDILFNLAVSLEQVRQPAVARQFYERALQASSKRPAGFDPATAKARVEALSSRR
ncbi:MAG: tetratricopeptide repeat protein [Rhodocyclaceae bacterium]